MPFKKYLVLISLLLVVAMLSGCGLIDRVTGKSKSQVEVYLPPPEESMQLPEEAVVEEAPELTEVVLYFSDPTGNYLVAERHKIPKVEGIARATMEELIKGPELGSRLLPTIPAGTVLRDINIRPDGLARVDFSKELIANHVGGSLGENLTVYSIVNTLTQFPTVNEVQFLVEGQYVSTIAGHVDVSTTVSRNESLIKKL